MTALSPRNEDLAQALVGLDIPRALGMLKKGANPSSLDAFFLGEGQGGCVSVLLKAVTDREEQVAFDLARQYRETGVAVDVKATLRTKNAPLRDAALGLVKALFRADPHLLLDNRARGHTPLQEAATLGWGRLVSWLVDQGADLAETNGYGRNAAHYAALWGHRDTLKRLAARSIDLDAQDQDRQTPAHLAAAHQHLEVMWVLKHYGADFSLSNTKGETPAQTLAKHEPALVAKWEALERSFEATPAPTIEWGQRRVPRP